MYRKFLFLTLVLMLTLSLFACGGAETMEEEVVGEEEVATEAPVDGYQMAEANELRTELGTLLSIAVGTGVEVADYCDTFWETWRDGTKEEMLQLADDHPKMVTMVAEAKAELNYVPTIINKVNELNIPAWYQDYFSKKEQLAGYLTTAFQQAEGFLSGVKPMVENMSDFISIGEGILDFWENIMPEIGSLITAESYSEARQMVATWTGSVDDMESLLVRAFGQAGVPVLTWFGDRCGALEEVLVLVIDWLEVKEAGSVVQVEQARSAILDFANEELEILESIPWDESNTWFETNFSSYINQVRDSVGQAVSVNIEAELAYETHWTPTAEELEQIYCVAATDAVGDVGDYFDLERYPERTPNTVGGHPEIDLIGAHTRVQGDNVIFWLEVRGDILDDSWVDYQFSGYTQPDYEGYMTIGYRDGEAEHYIAATGEFIPCEYYKSGGSLLIITSKDAFEGVGLWGFDVSASDGRLWMEEGQGYSDTIRFTK